MTDQSTKIQQLHCCRDEIIRCLKGQIDLLEKIKEAGLMTDGQTIFDGKNLPEKKSVLEDEIKKLQKFAVVLAVVGTMKSGKSTTINAIVGREIMPNRNRPMTALPTLIKHKPGQKEAVLKFDNSDIRRYVKTIGEEIKNNPSWRESPEVKEDDAMQKLIDILINNQFFEHCDDKGEIHNEEKLYQFLSYINDLVRLSEILRYKSSHSQKIAFPYHSCKNIEQLPIIEVEFSHLQNSQKSEQADFMLLDTPGPNEAGQSHLQEMLNEQLRRCSVVLLILDYTQMKSNADHEVRQQLNAIPDIDKNRLFALVNKFDQKTSNSDDINEVKDLIYSDLLKDRIDRNHIYPISSQLAYLANRMRTEIHLLGDKPDFKENSWIEDFAKKAFGQATDEEEWEDESLKRIQKRIDKLIEESLILIPITESIQNTESNAPLIAMQSALTKISQIIKEIYNVCEIAFETAQQNSSTESLKERIENLKGNIEKLKTIQDTVGDKLTTFKKAILSSISTKIEKSKKFLKIKITEAIIGEIKDIKNQLQQSGKEYKQSRGKLETREKLNELKRVMQEKEILLAKIRASQGDITFNNKDDRDNFYKKITELYRNLATAFANASEETVNTGKQEINRWLSDVEKECQEIYGAIEEQFKEGGFNLKMSCPIIDKLQTTSVNEIRYEREMKEKTETESIKKSGFWAGVRRFFGAGGYEYRSYTYYTDSLEEILNYLLEDLEEKLFRPIEQEIDHIFSTFSDEFITHYVGKVQEEATRLTGQLENGVNKLQKEGEEKKKYLLAVKELKNLSEESTQDIEGVKREVREYVNN